MEKIMDTDMLPGSTKSYVRLIEKLDHDYHVPLEVTKTFMMNFTGAIFQAELGNNYTKPISWIGLCIAAASLVCVLAMVADLLHGLRNQKLWFPCKYFITNAAFLSFISAAMKLPMDIATSMPGNVDQVTKLGSMAFLCTMMANLLPSLANMNKKELRTNIAGLGVMVITLVVNVCIQIQTGVVSYKAYDQFYHDVLAGYYTNKPKDMSHKHRNITIAAIYLSFLLFLLIIHICSSLAILRSKETIDVKYHVKNQELQEAVSKELQSDSLAILRSKEIIDGKYDVKKQLLHEAVSKEQQSDSLTVQKLRQHVSKYWIMAGSPQFVTVCFVTTSACGVICALSTALHIRTLFWNIDSIKGGDYDSDYKWSMLVIFVIQFIGVIVGTIAPLCRCFVALCFNLSIESIKHHIKVFEVESYWTQKLYDWKRPRSIKLSFRSHKWTVISEQVKIFLLEFCIAFQKAVVVTCKIISLVPLFMICTFCYLKCLKDKANVVVSSKMIKESSVELGNKNEDPEDIRPYVLKLQDETKISITTLKCISRSTRRLFRKGERQQPKDLFELLKEYTQRGKNINRDHVTSLLLKEDCWSLPVVTLTTIAVSLPDIDKSESEKLLVSVKEGLVYVEHVEQSLKTTNDSVSSQKAAGTLWHEFEVYKTWFENNMQENASKKNTSEIVQMFKEKSDDMVKKVSLDNGSQDDDSTCKSICAKSMDHITDEILLSHADHFNQRELFEHISQMISAILVHCLTNLPEAIAMKCHTSEIEKREATVQKAADLLCETTQIIETLQDHDPHRNDDLP